MGNCVTRPSAGGESSTAHEELDKLKAKHKAQAEALEESIKANKKLQKEVEDLKVKEAAAAAAAAVVEEERREAMTRELDRLGAETEAARKALNEENPLSPRVITDNGSVCSGAVDI